jgi:hypothetical protein
VTEGNRVASAGTPMPAAWAIRHRTCYDTQRIARRLPVQCACGLTARSHRMQWGWPSSAAADVAQHLQVNTAEQQYMKLGVVQLFTQIMRDGAGLLQQQLTQLSVCR